METLKAILTVVYSVAVIVGVLFLTYFATRWLAKKMNVQNTSSKLINVLDKAPLGQDKSLYVVKAGEKILLIGAAGGSITALAELSQSDIENIDNLPQQTEFYDVFKDNLKKLYNKKAGEESNNSEC